MVEYNQIGQQYAATYTFPGTKVLINEEFVREVTIIEPIPQNS